MGIRILDISSILPNYRSDDDEDQGDYDGGGIPTVYFTSTLYNMYCTFSLFLRSMLISQCYLITFPIDGGLVEHDLGKSSKCKLMVGNSMFSRPIYTSKFKSWRLSISS